MPLLPQARVLNSDNLLRYTTRSLTSNNANIENAVSLASKCKLRTHLNMHKDCFIWFFYIVVAQTRLCHVSGFKNIRICPSTRFQIVCGFKNIHSRERIQKVADSHVNSPDTCGRKANPDRKSCGFKNIWMRVYGILMREGLFLSISVIKYTA